MATVAVRRGGAVVLSGMLVLGGGGITTPAAAAGSPEITGLYLVDAATDTRISTAPLGDYETIDLAFAPATLNLEAAANDATQSVRFVLDGAPRVENSPPYAVGGDSAGDFFPTPRLRVPGWLMVTATPSSSDGGAGSVGPARTVHLYNRQPDHVVDTVVDAPDITPLDGVCRAAVRPGHPACTLRAAVQQANGLRGRQTISVPSGVYSLDRGELSVTSGMQINGQPSTPSSNGTVISAGSRSRVMRVKGTAADDILVDLNAVQLADGQVDTTLRGGNLMIEHAHVQVFDSVIRGGSANFGGGIYLQNRGNLLMRRSTLSGNVAGEPDSFLGGGITQRGGGIANLGGVVTIEQSALVDNRAVRGGAISNFGGRVTVTNTSIMGNDAASQGGGIENHDNFSDKGLLYLNFATITGNRAGLVGADPADRRVGGGVYNLGRAYVANTVLAGNSELVGAGPHASPDCYSPHKNSFTSYGHSAIGILGSTCLIRDSATGTTQGIIHGTATSPLDPGLGLRNDLPRAHRVPDPGSPLLDAGLPAGASVFPCPTHDVRDRPRPVGNGCDIGSTERQ